MKKLWVAVLIGGASSERDISLISGKEVAKALYKDKYEVKIYDPAKDLVQLANNRKKIDVVFPVLHGLGGEDGKIQGLLELLNLPYVGSGVLASALAMDKKMSQAIYKNAGILIPKTLVICKSAIVNNHSLVLQPVCRQAGTLIRIEIGFPCVVKANNQGSSVGVYIVRNNNELKKAIRSAFRLDKEVLVEEYIDGIEITASVLGNKNPVALPIIEIVPPEGKFFDREVKYNGTTQEIVPARLSKELAKEVQGLGIKAHQILGCWGMSRTDMIIQKVSKVSKVSKGVKIYVLETNTIPGMTSESLFPKAAKAAGITFPKLLDRLIQLALEG